MINLSARDLALVKRILRKYFPDREVRVFGSRATTRIKPYSDLDLAVMGSSKLPSRKLYALKDALEESELPMRVEVLDWNSISHSFRSVIEKKYKILQKPVPKVKTR
jgi:predicted nucleotidyltransferase